jgi:signal peptidase II
MPRPLRWHALAAAVIALDYLTKLAVLASFAPGERLALAPFFNLVLVFNTGAAFSFLAGAEGWQTVFFAAIAVVASIVISFLIVKNRNKSLLCSGLALILGGARGNIYDRLGCGSVVDVLDFHAAGWHWPAFNVADSAITVGAAILIVESFLQKKADETPA